MTNLFDLQSEDVVFGMKYSFGLAGLGSIFLVGFGYLSGEIKAVDEKLSGEIKAVDEKLEKLVKQMVQLRINSKVYSAKLDILLQGQTE